MPIVIKTVYENSSDHHCDSGVRRVQSAAYKTSTASDRKEYQNNHVKSVQFDLVMAGSVKPLSLLPNRPHTSTDRSLPPRTSSKANSAWPPFSDDAWERPHHVPVVIDSARLRAEMARTVSVIRATGVPLRPRQQEQGTSGRSCDGAPPITSVDPVKQAAVSVAALDAPRGPTQQRRTAGTSGRTCGRDLLRSPTTHLTLDDFIKENLLRLRQRNRPPATILPASRK